MTWGNWSIKYYYWTLFDKLWWFFTKLKSIKIDKNSKKFKEKINNPQRCQVDNYFDSSKKSILVNFFRSFYWDIWPASSHISFHTDTPDHIWALSYISSKSLTINAFPYSKSDPLIFRVQKSSSFLNLKNLSLQLYVNFTVFFISLMLHHAYSLSSNFEM